MASRKSSYKLSHRWECWNVKVAPGRYEDYMDFLATIWRKSMEFAVKKGDVVSYHVLSVNQPRSNEPDLVLCVQHRDYQSIAAKESFERELEAHLGSDARGLEAAAGERSTLRTVLGSIEYQELELLPKLK